MVEAVDVENGLNHEKFNTITVFGINLSCFPRNVQFLICASSMLIFSLLYGYCQEMISVIVLNRQLTLFLAAVQLGLYSFWSFVLFVMNNKRRGNNGKSSKHNLDIPVPLVTFLSLSFLKTMDLELSNRAMIYINYPAKTLLKSSRIFFVMVSGLIVGKRYSIQHYIIVLFLLSGLIIFLNADFKSVSTVFHPTGVIMMLGALLS